MTGLVIELQQEALDPTKPVSSLLRKALVVSRKLGLDDTEAWLSAELNGYQEDCPPYRRITGEIKVFNPYNGWIPLHFAKPSDAEVLRHRNCGQPIAELEELLKSDDKATYQMQFSPKLQKQLMDRMEFGMQPALVVSRTALVRIVDTVRNMVLEWALKLERDGVVGEGMTFSAQEKQNAQSASVIYQIQNQTVVQSMHASQIQQGTNASTQNYAPSAGFDAEAVRGLLRELRELVKGLALPPLVAQELEADLSTIEAQAAAPRPKVSILRESVASVRNVLENAIGGALGSAIPALPSILQKLGELVG
ncbi:hypothetical protein K7G19_10690 [Cupriavidus sp. DB3]|uniref:AbiTii domain-containing protein n=1 Tax=Cupriavidus sp. DB3 TaxID=2873259 RepID=UPI001CF5EF03|nr:hypothetical protein [Cupriavidus sp. DB3]MCA7084072.1 hypothetical protein [Cupriavidus sp. DB3]